MAKKRYHAEKLFVPIKRYDSKMLVQKRNLVAKKRSYQKDNVEVYRKSQKKCRTNTKSSGHSKISSESKTMMWQKYALKTLQTRKKIKFNEKAISKSHQKHQTQLKSLIAHDLWDA